MTESQKQRILDLLKKEQKRLNQMAQTKHTAGESLSSPAIVKQS